MKIGGKKGVTTENFVKKTDNSQQPGKAGAPEAKGAGKGSDSVDLSPRARELNRAKTLLAGVPEVRGEMVVKLKTDIESGGYSVDAVKVAEKMIERTLVNTISSKK